MLRLLRPILIGGGAAAGVGGALYAFQQYQLTRHPHVGHISSEWGIETRSHIAKAFAFPNPRDKAAEFGMAIDGLVDKNTQLQTKSVDWVCGYADLLRLLGLSLLAIDDVAGAEEAFNAASTIPYGTPGLQAEAAAAVYQLGDQSGQSTQKFVELANTLVFPNSLQTSEDLRMWAPLYIELAKVHLRENQPNVALSKLLHLHKAVATEDDPLCLKQTCGGYIGQIFWQLGDHNSGRKWLALSERESSKCSTPACRETNEVLRLLLARAHQ